MIAGGSSGIGLAIAKECVRRGIPTITLLARDVRKLQHAQMELEALAHSTTSSSGSTTLTTIRVRSVNITDAAELEQHAKDLSIPSTDRVVVWNCAGFSYPGEFLTVPIEKIQEQVQTNQIGTLYLVRAFLPYLHQGCIVLTSSAAGQIGVYGYTTYAPTKYAIRGFAETLHAELLLSHPHISLQIAYPIDTDTPGYQEELKTTPELTKKLSETAGAVATAHQYVRFKCRYRTVVVVPTVQSLTLTLTHSHTPIGFLLTQNRQSHGRCCLCVATKISRILYSGRMDVVQSHSWHVSCYPSSRCNGPSGTGRNISNDWTLCIERLVEYDSNAFRHYHHHHRYYHHQRSYHYH